MEEKKSGFLHPTPSEVLLKLDFSETEDVLHIDALLTYPFSAIARQSAVILDFEPHPSDCAIHSITLLDGDSEDMHLEYEHEAEIDEYFAKYYNSCRDIHSLDGEDRALAGLRKKGTLMIKLPQGEGRGGRSATQDITISIKYTLSHIFDPKATHSGISCH